MIAGDLTVAIQRRRAFSPTKARKLRQQAHMSLVELADEVGCSYDDVGRWERGEHRPSRRWFDRYLAVLADLEEALK